jgi:hypothetical protein
MIPQITQLAASDKPTVSGTVRRRQEEAPPIRRQASFQVAANTLLSAYTGGPARRASLENATSFEYPIPNELERVAEGDSPILSASGSSASMCEDTGAMFRMLLAGEFYLRWNAQHSMYCLDDFA